MEWLDSDRPRLPFLSVHSRRVDGILVRGSHETRPITMAAFSTRLVARFGSVCPRGLSKRLSQPIFVVVGASLWSIAADRGLLHLCRSFRLVDESPRLGCRCISLFDRLLGSDALRSCAWVGHSHPRYSSARSRSQSDGLVRSQTAGWPFV